MIRPFRGAPLLIGLAACVAPLRAPEAQSIAREQLARYCRKLACGDTKPGRLQKFKDRWLVDYESQRYRFTVAVEDNGNAKVTVWNKQ